MKNTNDILSSTGSGCNWCSICWPAKKQVSDTQLIVATGPMPPEAAKTNGEKQALSTSRIRSSYARRFSCSWLLNLVPNLPTYSPSRVIILMKSWSLLVTNNCWLVSNATYVHYRVGLVTKRSTKFVQFAIMCCDAIWRPQLAVTKTRSTKLQQTRIYHWYHFITLWQS